MPDFKPHPYQERGIQWILDHKSCGLFLPMGAGKTVTTLCALDLLLNDYLAADGALVVGPKRVIETTWPEEIMKWKPGLTFSVISGKPDTRKKAMVQKADIHLVGKDNLAWLIDEAGKHWPWKIVVIDELSAFKNPRAKKFKALKTVRPRIERLIGLTGTPSPKGIPDLWSQIYLLDQGRTLGRTLTVFRQKYLRPARAEGHIVYQWAPLPGAEAAIQEALKPLCMSIDESEYASLPDLQMIRVPVDLKKDLKGYRDFKRSLVLEFKDEQVLAANAGVLCGKLLQYTSGTVYGKENRTIAIHSHKIEALGELLEQANHEPMLIFYWFQSEREAIQAALSKNYKGACANSKEALRAWNAGELDYLLLQPASAGHGLNLQQGGHLAVWFSLPNWNLELYQQANARIYRQGQQQKVVIYHLLAKGTIDEEMLKALEKKEITQRDLLSALSV